MEGVPCEWWRVGVGGALLERDRDGEGLWTMITLCTVLLMGWGLKTSAPPDHWGEFWVLKRGDTRVGTKDTKRVLERHPWPPLAHRAGWQRRGGALWVLGRWVWGVLLGRGQRESEDHDHQTRGGTEPKAIPVLGGGSSEY